MNKYFHKGILLIFPLVLGIACIAGCYVAQYFHVDDTRLLAARAGAYNEGWIRETGMDDQGHATLTLTNQLPEIYGPDAALCFRTLDSRVHASVDGQTIYSYGENNDIPFGHNFGVIWNLIPLPTDGTGKTIQIELTYATDEIPSTQYTFYLDHRNIIITTLLDISYPIIINCLLGLLASIVMMITGIFHFLKNPQNGRTRIYLSSFIILALVYTFGANGLFQFLIDNKAVAHFIVYSSLMLQPIPFVLYAAEQFPRWANFYRKLSIGYCAYYVLRLLLYALNIAELSQYLWITLLLMIVGFSLTVLFCFKERKQQSNRIMLFGISVFAVFVFITIVFYYTTTSQQYRIPYGSISLMLGIDSLVCSFYIALLKSSLNTVSRAQLYEHQAYTDALTQVRNRAAFNLATANMTPSAYPRLTLYMVDLNNLKQVNDTLGHPTGDRVISTFANYLQEAFIEIGTVYRYGGDEFVIVIPDTPRNTIRNARLQLEALISDHNLHSGSKISVAIGVASRQIEGYAQSDVDTLLHLADDAMYQSKAIQKADPDLSPEFKHRQLEQMDPATGILSFPAFKSRIYNVLMNQDIANPCIVNFDLNFFDGYNSLFGWNAGNQILQKLTEVAMRLCSGDGFCGHDYADSFWIFLDIPDMDELKMRIRQESKAFQNSLDGCMLFPSFGIYRITERMLPVSDMCSRATNAKKRIKGHLDMLYNEYSIERHRQRTENMKMTAYMQNALDNDAFVPYYQPKFQLNGRLAGAEALVRWPRSDAEASSPAEFTTLFEKSGLILSLDWYMLEKTCVFLRKYLDAGMACVPISNNFSRLHIYEEDCMEHILRLTERYRIPHELIEIELTETAFVDDAEPIFDLIATLQAEGFSVSLDDFGSGVSSLGSLNNVHVDTIKIDRSLIENQHPAKQDNSIFELVVSLCKQLKIQTLAEGVETREQYNRLRNCGCELVQGNYFSPALSQPDFESLLKKRQKELKWYKI